MGRAEDLWNECQKDGLTFITRLLTDKIVEELFLDYKRSADNGGTNTLHDSDKNNFAKAISGFGNSEGGIIVWGIECKDKGDGKGDVPTNRFPIKHVAKFTGWLTGAVSGLVVPPHTGVQTMPIPLDKYQPEGEGFAVSLIPKYESSPLQSIREYKYFIRAGSNFSPTPHDVLAGMFGCRPQARLKVVFDYQPEKLAHGFVKLSITPIITNLGRAMGRELYISHSIWNPSVNGKAAIAFNQEWQTWALFNQFQSIALPVVLLPPGGRRTAPSIEVTFKPPFHTPLRIETVCGSEGTPVKQIFKSCGECALLEFYDKFQQGDKEEAIAILFRELNGNGND